MDRFFDRLGEVIKGFLDEEDERIFPRSGRSSPIRDPDLDAAYDELDEFLKTGKSSGGGRAWADPSETGYGRSTAGGAAGAGAADGRRRPAASTVPEGLRADFQELGVPFGADAAACKAAYKRLLKIHHPDRHAGHPGNMKKATEKSARINASFRRIEEWRETGRLD